MIFKFIANDMYDSSELEVSQNEVDEFKKAFDLMPECIKEELLQYVVFTIEDDYV